MTRRISSSRPMTGSSLPARASAVRSRPYFSSAWYVPSGCRRGHALAAANALQRLEDRLPSGGVPLEQLLGLAAGLGDTEQQVLGRGVLVAEPPCLGLGTLDDALGAGIERQRAALDPGTLGEDRGELAAERGQVDAQPAQRLGGDAVVRLDERAEEVLGVEDRAVQPLGGLLGGDDGLLGLLGEAIELHVRSLWVRSVSVDRVGRRRRRSARAASLASSVRSVGRTTLARTYRSPWPSARNFGMPRPRSRNCRPGCVPGGIRRSTVALRRPNRHLGAEEGLLRG